MPDDLEIHAMMDNHATLQAEAIRNWFAGHPRCHIHFTPTSASRLNQAERFFAELTERQLRRGVYRSTSEPELAISDTSTRQTKSHRRFDGTIHPTTFSPPSSASVSRHSRPRRPSHDDVIYEIRTGVIGP